MKFIRRHKTEAIAATLVLAVALTAVGYAVWEQHRALENARAELVSQRSRGRRSVAVLGFKNLSGHAETAWLSVALSEMLTTELSAGGKLRTISGESVAQAKTNLSLSETDSFSTQTLQRLCNNLGSDFVVVGSYLDMSDTNRGVRLDLRVQDAAIGETIATVSETGQETALSDLVARAGAALRDRLGIAGISPAESASLYASLPSNPDLARLYGEGLSKLRVFDATAARDLLEKAVHSDPKFALAHSALSDAWGALGYQKKAQEQSKIAFELAADLPREQNLLLEARYLSAVRQWAKQRNDGSSSVNRPLLPTRSAVQASMSLLNLRISGGSTRE